MRQAYQTPLTADVVEAAEQKAAKTTYCLDLAKHRFHHHLASGVQRLAWRRPHLCCHARWRCGWLLRHWRLTILVTLAPRSHGRLAPHGLQRRHGRLTVIATVQSRRDGLGGA